MPMLYATLAWAARPPLAEATKEAVMTARTRTKQVNIRVSTDEYATLMAEAEKAGMQVSAFVRDAALRKRIKSVPPAINAEAWITLGKIFNNLNQIARHLNTAARSGGEDTAVEQVRSELETLRREIQAARMKLMEAMK